MAEIVPLSSKGGAIVSGCQRYRYLLWRELAGTGGVVAFVMLNPSTADALVDDPTIRRCKGFANRLGARLLVVLNAFAFRATDPSDLVELDRDVAIGEKGDASLTGVPLDRTVIVAWGASPLMGERQHEVVKLLGNRPLFCLGTTANGSPRHPLYVRSDAPLVPWTPATPSPSSGRFA